jgi:hypothetical protein
MITVIEIMRFDVLCGIVAIYRNLIFIDGDDNETEMKMIGLSACVVEGSVTQIAEV